MLSLYIVEVFVLACWMVAGSDSIGPACLCASISAFLEGPTHLKRQLNQILFDVVHVCSIQRVRCHCWCGVCHRWLRIPHLRCLKHHRPLTWATTQRLRWIQSTLQLRYLLCLYAITSAITCPARPLGEILFEPSLSVRLLDDVTVSTHRLEPCRTSSPVSLNSSHVDRVETCEKLDMARR